MISLIIITKNESRHIIHCLNSCRELIDEVSLVDTGSWDVTVSLTQDWCKNNDMPLIFNRDDFSQGFGGAKDYALKQSNGDWCLFLDADERFIRSGLMKKLMPQLEKDGVESVNLNFINPSRFSNGKFITEKVSRRRLVKRDCISGFETPIHENLIFIKPYNNLDLDMSAYIVHLGYDLTTHEKIRKSSKYENEMIKYLKNHSDDGRLWYHLGQSILCNDKKSVDLKYKTLLVAQKKKNDPLIREEINLKLQELSILKSKNIWKNDGTV